MAAVSGTGWECTGQIREGRLEGEGEEEKEREGRASKPPTDGCP